MGKPVQYAGFWARSLAFLLDAAFLWSLDVILFDYVFDISGLAAQMSLVMVIPLYFFLFTFFSGQTLGKMILGIKVVPAAFDKPAWEDVLLREIIGKCVSILVLFAGLFMMAVNPKKQALHDKLSGMCVIWEENIH
jgi:uncharacterized RDD family membrane protein YckC